VQQVRHQHGGKARPEHRQEHRETSRHLGDKDDAGNRSLHHAGEKGRHADYGKSCRVDIESGEGHPAQGADEHAELPSENQHRREQPARRRRGVRDRTKDEAQQEGQRDHGHRHPAGEHSLGNRVAAADQIGCEPGEQPDRCADQPRLQFYRPPVEALRQPDRSE